MTDSNLMIETARLLLQPVQLSDLEDIWPHVSDPEISKDMSWDPHRDKDETAAFITRLVDDRRNEKNFTWVIRRKDTGLFCGLFSIISILWKHRSLIYNRAEIAYWCARDQQGQGFMSEAGVAVLDFAFGQKGLNRLEVGHHIGNTGSEKLILRLGFTYTGTEHEVFQKHGHWIDVKFYELLKKDWERMKPTLPLNL